MNWIPGNLEQAKFLVEAGINVRAKNDEGETAEDIATRKGNFICE